MNIVSPSRWKSGRPLMAAAPASNVHRLPIAKGSLPRIMSKGSTGELYLYGPIGADWFGDGVSAKQFADDLKKLDNASTIDVRINSEGGDVFAGKAMYTLLSQHKAKVVVHIDGIAASAASFIAMAGNEIEIAEAAFVMVHDAYGVTAGRAADMRAFADLLDATNASIVDIYAARTKNKPDQIAKWMDAETWMSGKDALKNGFADRMVENMKVAASISDPSKFKNLPAALRPNRVKADAVLSRMAARAKTIK
jgi:ATP-dependent Clp protease protease subunit